MPQKSKENVVKLPKTLIPFQLASWCENYFNKNKKIPTQKEIEEANVKLTKRALSINSIYGVSGSTIANKKSNKGVTTYVIGDEPMSDYPDLNVDLIQHLSSIKNRFSKKDYENGKYENEKR